MDFWESVKPLNAPTRCCGYRHTEIPKVSSDSQQVKEGSYSTSHPLLDESQKYPDLKLTQSEKN